MSDHIDVIRDALARVPQIAVTTGTYIGYLDGQFWVDVDFRIPVSMMCPEPQTNDTVHVLTINGVPYVTGMVTPPPTEGTVQTVGTTRVTVATDRGEFSVPFLSSYTPASGNVVQLGYTGTAGLHVIGVLSDEIVAPETPPVPETSGGRAPGLITANWSGSARQGTANWFTNQVWAIASNIGLYGYGTKVRDTFTAFGVPDRLEVYLPVVSDKYGNNRLGWHPYETRSGVTPPVTSVRTVTSGWVDITDLAPRLATGGGIGFDGAGQTVYKGVPMDGKPGDTQAGALRLSYN